MHYNIKTVAYLSVALTMFFAGAVRAQSGDMANPKTIAENDKMLVQETYGKPGESTAPIKRTGQFYYYIQGGTVELTYSDGTKTTVTRKTGESRIVTEKRPYSAKNVGGTTLHVIIVSLK